MVLGLLWLLILALLTRGVFWVVDRCLPAVPARLEAVLPLKGKWLRMLLLGPVAFAAALMAMPVGELCSDPGGCEVLFVWSGLLGR